MTSAYFKNARIYVLLLVLVASIWLAISVIQAVTTYPTEGDSLTLHIPLAKSLFTYQMLIPNAHAILYPAAIESILLVFIKLGIPLNLFNLFGVVILFIGLTLLGKRLGFDYLLSITFGVAIILLHGVVRWSQTQKPDIWMLAFFTLGLWSLLKKKKGLRDFFLLGLTSGFFIGAKFTAPVFLAITLVVFRKYFFSSLNIYKGIFFLIPFLIIGCSWYIRNYLIVGSPVYLDGYSFLAGNAITPLTDHTWKGYILYPHYFFDAYISEYLIWGFGIIFVPVWLLYKRNIQKNILIFKFYLIAASIFFISLLLPFWNTYTQIVGTMRYTFPMALLLVLCVFLIAKREKKELLMIQIVLVVTIISIFPYYHPKLIFFTVPLLFLFHFRKYLFNFLEKKKI